MDWNHYNRTTPGDATAHRSAAVRAGRIWPTVRAPGRAVSGARCCPSCLRGEAVARELLSRGGAEVRHTHSVPARPDLDDGGSVADAMQLAACFRATSRRSGIHLARRHCPSGAGVHLAIFCFRTARPIQRAKFGARGAELVFGRWIRLSAASGETTPTFSPTNLPITRPVKDPGRGKEKICPLPNS